MNSHYQDIVNAPLQHVKRISEITSRLQESLIEVKTISAIQEENYSRENVILDKKLFEMTKNYDHEVVTNDKLYKDLTFVRQRNKMMQQTIETLRYEIKRLESKVDNLQDYKYRKRKKFKLWLKRRLRKCKKIK